MKKSSNSDPIEKYKETQVKTASQGKLIVMLYDGAIKFLNTAKDAVKTNNVEESHNKLTRAQDIIMELILSLNLEAGEIAKKLYNLYLYMNTQLMQANIYKKTEPIDEVIKLMTDLKEVWQQVSAKSSAADGKGLEKNTSVNIST